MCGQNGAVNFVQDSQPSGMPPQRLFRPPDLRDECRANLFLLSQDCFVGLPEETGRQPPEQRSQAGLQRNCLVSGQPLDEPVRQHLLRLAQCLGLNVMEAGQ